MPKYLYQSSIWKFKTSTSNSFQNLNISITNHILHLLNKVQIYENCFANCSPICCHFFWLLHLYKKSIYPSKHGPVGKKLANQVTLISILFWYRLYIYIKVFFQNSICNEPISKKQCIETNKSSTLNFFNLFSPSTVHFQWEWLRPFQKYFLVASILCLFFTLKGKQEGWSINNIIHSTMQHFYLSLFP